MRAQTKTTFRIYQGFRFPPDICRWLRLTSARCGKTKTRLLEEAVRAKMALKQT